MFAGAADGFLDRGSIRKFNSWCIVVCGGRYEDCSFGIVSAAYGQKAHGVDQTYPETAARFLRSVWRLGSSKSFGIWAIGTLVKRRPGARGRSWPDITTARLGWVCDRPARSGYAYLRDDAIGCIALSFSFACGGMGYAGLSTWICEGSI